MTETLFTVPDDWVKPEAPALPAVTRTVNERLIPPSIRDARSKAVLGAFVYGAKQFDFRRLLARVSSEMSAEELPLALYERSLDRYVGPDGLPESVVRDLIDHAFIIKGLEGLDEGVELALSLLGIRAQIIHWWQTEPEGHHDTHEITIFVNQHLFDDQTTILNTKTQRAAKTVIEATKRYSQDTSFRIGAVWTDTIGVADLAHVMAVSRCTIDAGPNTEFEQPIAAADALTGLQIQRRTINAGPDTAFNRPMAAANAAHTLEIHRLTFAGAA